MVAERKIESRSLLPDGAGESCFPGEGRWLTGDASAQASEETGMQLDPMQARFDELLRRLESQESLVRSLQVTQVLLNEDTRSCLVDN